MPAVILVVACAAFLISDAPYLQDFAEWLYQAQILKNLIFDPASVSGFTVFPYPVPNSLATLLLAALSVFLPPIWAGKLFLVLLLMTWFAVISRLAARYFGADLRAPVILVLFSLTALSSFFWYGFVAYQLSLLLFTWFLSLEEEQITLPKIAFFSVAIFLAHAMTFLVFGALLCARMLVRREFSIAMSLVPAGLLSAGFLIGRRLTGFTPSLADGPWTGPREVVLDKIGTPAMMGPFRNILQADGSSFFEGWAWIYWLGFFSNIAIVAALGVFAFQTLWKSRWLLRSNRRDAHASDTATAFTIFFLMLAYIVAPYNFFGLIDPGGRLMLPTVLLLFVLGRDDVGRIVRLLFWPVATLTLVTCASYFFTVVNLRPPGNSADPPPHADHFSANSVFGVLRAQNPNTRFIFYNCRVFAFAERFDHIAAEDYRYLSFETGLITTREPDSTERAEPPQPR
jgi:hypothetical protein